MVSSPLRCGGGARRRLTRPLYTILSRLLLPSLLALCCGVRGFRLHRPLQPTSYTLRGYALRHHSGAAGRRASALVMSAKGGLILGLNKYSHDVGVCIVDKHTGKVLFVAEKERLSRRKHDAGDAADLVEHALESIGRTLEDVGLVVQNNHHFRVAPFERRLPWSVAQEHFSVSYLDEHNLLPNARHHELSHHLAHLWSVMPQAPFTEGLVVIMDGMGELHSAMARALSEGEAGYTHDLLLANKRAPGFVQVPRSLDPTYGHREGESAYLFKGTGVTPVYKRWVRERSPPELFNHGFHDMESLGAVYSRISSHVFGDWNTCGKVMGLAPYGRLMREKGEGEDTEPLMGGDLFKDPSEEGAFAVNWAVLEGLQQPNEWRESDRATFESYARVSDRVQRDLEDSALRWIAQLKEKTGAKNLCLAGGVALNSVLNGRVTRELGFESVFIPPYPGDEGIAVGCALYGLHQLAGYKGAGLGGRYLLPYQGKAYSAEEMLEGALRPSEPWVEVQPLANMEQVVEDTAIAIAGGEVVAWFQGRAEVGPRALGSRSILADPRVSDMVERLNGVKRRERFRPFAPSVIAEDARAWFEMADPNGSPFMSVTVAVRPERRGEVPAICHVDGTARLQTVREQDNPWYHRLISVFKRLTGVGMVLNTSFNIGGEPIVEDPKHAVESFLNAKGGIDRLVLGTFVVRRRPFPPDVEEEAGLLVPFKVPYLLEDILADAETGEARSVRIARGSVDGTPQWTELHSEMDLAVMQVVDGLTPLEEVVEAVQGEWVGEEPLPASDVMEAVRRLYNRRLLGFPVE